MPVNVKSPYNFVPLNKKVFFPHWAKYVNQDVPFNDALSGKIPLKITAKTPIFVRGEKEINEVTPRIGETDIYQYRFFKHKNKYCIPGTSIKGELASVMEIMSFGKLKQVNDEYFSQRDWNNESIFNKKKFANVKGGWLSKTDKGYLIRYSKKKLGRISHNQIDTVFTNFSTHYSTAFSEEINGITNSKHKYEITKCIGENDIISFKEIKAKCKIVDYKNKCVIDKNVGSRGLLVFTGQSSKRKNTGEMGDGKGVEYVFWIDNLENEFYNDINNEIHPKIKDFFTVYNDHKKETEQSEDWKMWKKHLNNGGEIPIFITIKNDKIEHFGLSMLYRLLYKKTLKDLIKDKDQHNNKDLDLVECIFGMVDEKGDDALKGRVSIEPALCTNEATEMPLITSILGSPKASYYPFYIKQNVVNNNNVQGNYNTYNDNEVISGRKRYAVTAIDTNIEKPISKTSVTFKPLPTNTEFETSIHYHNLRPVELGALLSALSFHNTQECHHSIGMAKPLGFGNVVFEIKFDDKEKYMCLYEKMMTDFKNDWIKSEQLKELCTLAKPVGNISKLKYPKLETSPRVNEFADIKSDKKALPRYSDFIGGNFAITPTSLLTENCAYNFESDKALFKTNTAGLGQEVNNYKIEKSKKLKTKIDDLINKINDTIAEKQRVIDDSNREQMSIQEDIARIEFRKKGIEMLQNAKRMGQLISATTKWSEQYYTQTEINNIKPPKTLIPDKYIIDFIEIINGLFKKKDKVWRGKDYTKTTGYKYLKKCIGKNATEKWFENKELKK